MRLACTLLHGNATTASSLFLQTHIYIVSPTTAASGMTQLTELCTRRVSGSLFFFFL